MFKVLDALMLLVLMLLGVVEKLVTGDFFYND